MLVILTFLLPTALIYLTYINDFWYFPVYRFLYLVPIILCSLFFSVSAAVVCFLIAFAFFVPIMIVNFTQGTSSWEVVISMFLLMGVGITSGIFLEKNKKEKQQYSLLSYIYQKNIIPPPNIPEYLSGITEKLNQLYPAKMREDRILVQNPTPQDNKYLLSVEEAINLFLKKYNLYQRTISLRNFIQIATDEINYGILIIRTSGEIIFSNKFLNNLIKEEVVDKYYLDVFPDEFSGKITEIINNLGEDSHREEKLILNIREKEYPILLEVLPIKNKENQVQEIMLIVEDISEKEKIIAQNNLDKLRQDFIRSISHKTKMSLSSILGFILTLLSDKEGYFDENAKGEFYNIIYLEAERLIRLVNNIFLFSKIESDQKITLSLSEVNLSSLISEEIFFVKEFTSHHQIISKIPPDIIIFADKEKLRQVIYNILSSIICLSPSGGEITVLIEDEDNFILLSVENKKLNILEEEKEKMFIPFYVIKGLDIHPEGSVELFLSRYLSNLMGGKIYFPENKTIFCLEIPKHKGGYAPFTTPVVDLKEELCKKK